MKNLYNPRSSCHHSRAATRQRLLQVFTSPSFAISWRWTRNIQSQFSFYWTELPTWQNSHRIESIPGIIAQLLKPSARLFRSILWRSTGKYWNFRFVLIVYSYIRLILVCILTVHKYYNDHFYLNSYLAHIGGLELGELNHLERMFLEILDFNLSIDIEEYENYKTGLTAFYTTPLNDEIL